MPGKPLKRDWLHCNSLDYNAESGHLVINSVQGELYVIDHEGNATGTPPHSQRILKKSVEHPLRIHHLVRVPTVS
jgi:hypothetical protein